LAVGVEQRGELVEVCGGGLLHKHHYSFLPCSRIGGNPDHPLGLRFAALGSRLRGNPREGINPAADR
jgi:hypothetical protein